MAVIYIPLPCYENPYLFKYKFVNECYESNISAHFIEFSYALDGIRIRMSIYVDDKDLVLFTLRWGHKFETNNN